MQNVLIALVPAVVASVLIFGFRALLLEVICMAACVLFEFLFEKATKRDLTIYDCSAMVTGLILALNLPPTLPIWMAVFGCLAAIVLGKQLFGGIGMNFANPAIVGRIVLLIAFAQPMTTWVLPNAFNFGADLVSGATPLGVLKMGEAVDLSYGQLFLGLRGGCLGETCILALLIGGIYLIAKKIISPIIPVAYLATVFVASACFGRDPIFELLTGGVVLGAFFCATDYVTSPVTNKGKLIFGIGCGVLTILIRVFANYPEGASFSILLMNILTPHIDALTMSKPFGGAKE